MNHLQKLIRQIALRVFWLVLLVLILTIIASWIVSTKLQFSQQVVIAALGLITVILAVLSATIAAKIIAKPIQVLWQAILHVSRETSNEPAPNLDKVKIGHELVASLVLQVYQLASSGGSAESADTPLLQSKIERALARNLPLPVLAMDQNFNLLFVNHAAQTYCGLPGDAVGKNFYSLLDLSFPSQQTLEAWLKTAKVNKVTDAHTWERVRLKLPDQKTVKLLDMAASYSKSDPSGAETLVAMFDHSERYAQDDNALSFVALAVHELRTPLTVLRGYIEVFEEEFSAKLTPELSDFMRRMQASSEALASFVNNILNVARIEDNQLVLRLSEEKWDIVLSSAIDNVRLRAQVHDKTIDVQIAPDLPSVAVDRVSVYEVISNLLDNAIKYSGEGPKQILVRSYLNQEGLIETTIQDFGVGVSASISANLFEKFYRWHQTRSQIGGTGLGLYLSKSIVSAHGGNIWVRSKEGQGATFGFTLLPYSRLAEEQKNNDNKGITRSAYGWIKNHSLYRR